LKEAKDLTKDFLEVLHMFTRFITLKYQVPKLQGGVDIRGIDIVVKALVTSSHYKYLARELNLVVLDTRQGP